MATEREMRKALAPVLERFPSWKFHRGSLFCLPIGYYYRGVNFGYTSNRLTVKVWRCVHPLYESKMGIHGSWGQICSIPGVTNFGWRIDHPGFSSSLITIMEHEIIPTTAHIQTGGDFDHYMSHSVTRSGWTDWARALAFLHSGDLDNAHHYLKPLANQIRKEFPQLHEPGIWGENLIELLRLIDEDPNAIPAHCEAVARHTIVAAKLEKYWEPTPFVYDARLSPRRQS